MAEKIPTARSAVQVSTKVDKIMEKTTKQQSAGEAINDCLFWLEGLIDGTCRDRAEQLTVLSNAQVALATAMQRLVIDTMVG